MHIVESFHFFLGERKLSFFDLCKPCTQCGEQRGRVWYTFICAFASSLQDVAILGYFQYFLLLTSLDSYTCQDNNGV